MKPFIYSNFINSLRRGYESIPYIQGNDAAQKMVADSIKSNGFNAKDVLTYISKEMNLSNTLNENEWKAIIDSAIKLGYPVAGSLKAYKPVLKGKLSNEGMFNLAAASSGIDADALRIELLLNQFGWQKAVETLVKSSKIAAKEKSVKKVVAETAKTVKKKAATKKEEHKSSIKSDKKDPRCVAIIGIKDGERREWDSFRACELDLNAGHGTVSQFFTGKVKTVKGWTLYKKGEEPKVKAPKSTKTSKTKKVAAMTHPKHKAVIQILPNGKQKKWESLTAASKGTVSLTHPSVRLSLAPIKVQGDTSGRRLLHRGNSMSSQKRG